MFVEPLYDSFYPKSDIFETFEKEWYKRLVEKYKKMHPKVLENGGYKPGEIVILKSRKVNSETQMDYIRYNASIIPLYTDEYWVDK